MQVADRWHMNFRDRSGSQGMLGQVRGRTADDAAYGVLQATPTWRDRAKVIAIDMCTVFRSAGARSRRRRSRSISSTYSSAQLQRSLTHAAGN